MSLIPDIIQQWFESRQWRVRDFQRQVMEKAHHANAVLLMAPTGAGKTLSGFLPALSDLATGGATHNRLHTLYISPLKALTQDIHRNLLIPIEDMALSIYEVRNQLELVVRRTDEACEILNDLLYELWGEDGEEIRGTELEDIEERLRLVEQELIDPLRSLGQTAVAVRRLARRG